MVKIKLIAKINLFLVVVMMFFVSGNSTAQTVTSNEGIQNSATDPVKGAETNVTQGPQEYAYGKIATVSENNIELAGILFLIDTDTRFYDQKKEQIGKDAFIVGEQVEIVYVQPTFQILEIRKQENISTTEDNTQTDDTPRNQDIKEKTTIKRENGVYVN